jgi:hypothetical protein
MLCSLFYMPCELHPRIKVIVYVSFFRLNESNFDNCSQLEPKNIMLKSKSQIVVQKTKIELQKIERYDQKLRFPNEIPSTFRVIWCFVKYLVFRLEIPVFKRNTRYFQRKSQFSFWKIWHLYICDYRLPCILGTLYITV